MLQRVRACRQEDSPTDWDNFHCRTTHGHMEKPQPKEGMLKIPSEANTIRLIPFSFVPILTHLPSEDKVTVGEQERLPMRRSNEFVEKQKEAAADLTMSGDGVFKADFVYVGGDLDEGEPGDRRALLARETALRQEAHSQLRLPAEHMTQGQLAPSEITAPSESAAYLFVNTSPAIKHAAPETVNNKHRSTDVRGYDTALASELSPGLLLKQVPDKRATLASALKVTHSPEGNSKLLETPTTSRESVLSEDWFGSRVLSSEGSPASLSRTISPCSSVRSGAFSPFVIRVKRHSLAPGSSLVWNFQPCLSPASGSHAPSPNPLSRRTGRAWQRPPPTQLTLLTAILRKGRLPILSSVQQREYCPCWPISAVSLSSCRACNAAAKLALICPAVAPSQSKTAIEGPQTPARHTPSHEPESPPLTPPPSPDLSEPVSTDCAWHKVLSLTQQHTVPSLAQLRTVPSPTLQRTVPSQQCRAPSPTQQRTVPSPIQQRTVPFPSQQQRIPSPTQLHRIPFLTQQHRVPSLTQQYTVPSPTQQHKVPSPTQQHRVSSPAQQHRVPSQTYQSTVPSRTQQYTVPSLTQQSHAASPSASVMKAAPDHLGLPLSNNPQETLPPVSTTVLSSSFLKLRSLSPKSSSPSLNATGNCPAPSPVLKFTCPPLSKLICTSEPKLTSTTEHKLTCSPEIKFPCTPEPKLTCTSEPKLTSTSELKLACSPEIKFTCTPDPKLSCSLEPKLTHTPELKVTCSPEPKLTCTPEPKLTCTPEPKFTSSPVPRCDEIRSLPATSPVPIFTFAPKPTCSEARHLYPLQNSTKLSPQPTSCRLLPAAWTPTLSPSPCASPRSLGMLSLLSHSHSSTPDRLSLSPSPLTSSRDLLTPSPSLSPSLSPSSSPVPRGGSDRAGRKRKYKIKSSYKALAAIPTNTLLLEQQAIDDEVEKEGRPLEEADLDRVTETRSEMCSPAQLRQQSEELYAAIDQVLQDPLPMRRSQSAPQSLVTLTDVEVPKKLTSLPRSAGRETKYATFHLQPSGSAERTLTKPGVIRPVTVIPKLTEEEVEEEDFPNPFRQQYLEEISEAQSRKFVRAPAGQITPLAGIHREPGSSTFTKGDITRNDEVVLLITEKEDTSTPPMAEGTSKIGPASLTPAQTKTHVRETHF